MEPKRFLWRGVWIDEQKKRERERARKKWISTGVVVLNGEAFAN